VGSGGSKEEAFRVEGTATKHRAEDQNSCSGPARGQSHKWKTAACPARKGPECSPQTLPWGQGMAEKGTHSAESEKACPHSVVPCVPLIFQLSRKNHCRRGPLPTRRWLR
jgi:hypothetical protein